MYSHVWSQSINEILPIVALLTQSYNHMRNTSTVMRRVFQEPLPEEQTMAGWTGDGGRGDQQEAIEQQYEYNNKMWSYNWAETQSNYAYQQENIAIQKINEQALRNYQNQTNFNGWLNRENIRMYEYGKDVEAYNASVESYEKQLDYNDIAYDIALNDANRVYQDQLIGFGFQNQDLLMKYHEGGEQASLDTKGLTNKLGQAQRLSDCLLYTSPSPRD